MRIVRDTRLVEFKRIEHLLYGINYEVWFNLYGPADPELGLTDTLKCLISKDCEISGVVPSTPNEAISEIMDMVLYKGDTGSGPLELGINRVRAIDSYPQRHSLTAEAVVKTALQVNAVMRVQNPITVTGRLETAWL